MAQTFDPSIANATVLFPRQVAGFRRLVQVNHPLCGSGTLLSTDASFNDAGNPNYTKYAATPGFGPKQKTIHSAGTREVTWSVAGEVTSASLGLLNLLWGKARGVNFNSLLISQGTANFYFDNAGAYGLPWNQFSVSGNQNAGLTFSLEGKATVDPSTTVIPIAPVVVSTPVPSWTTGNELVLSWSLSHSTNLQPHWFNNPSMLPAYYRALDSEFTLQLTTAKELCNYTLVRIGYGNITFTELILTSANITFGDRNSTVTYEASSTNVGIASQANAYNEFVNITLNGVPDAGYG